MIYILATADRKKKNLYMIAHKNYCKAFLFLWNYVFCLSWKDNEIKQVFHLFMSFYRKVYFSLRKLYVENNHQILSEVAVSFHLDVASC